VARAEYMTSNRIGAQIAAEPCASNGPTTLATSLLRSTRNSALVSIR
jgi:hypothetical protein